MLKTLIKYSEWYNICCLNKVKCYSYVFIIIALHPSARCIFDMFLGQPVSLAVIFILLFSPSGCG